MIALCVLGAAVYANSLRGSFHYDDQASIVQNLVIRDLGDLAGIWNYWPTRFVTYLSLAFNYRLGGLEVFGYHIANLAFHLVATVLTWQLVLLTFATPALRNEAIARHKRAVAFFAAAVFATHPVQTQAVDYIIQRAALLAALFCLLSLLCYAKARRGQGAVRWAFGVLALLAQAAALFSKESAIATPFLIILYELSFFPGKDRGMRRYLWFFLAAGLVLPATMLLTRSVDVGGLRRAVEPSAGISVGHYVLTQARVLVAYLRLLFFPAGQTLDHEFPLSVSLADPRVFLSLGFLGSILAGAATAWKKHRLVSFGAFWFFLALLPESSVIPIKDVFVEHRLYLPMFGFAVSLVAGAFGSWEGRPAKPLFVFLVLLVVFYSAFTLQRNKAWVNDLVLWDDAVRKSPGKARPYNNRGFAYYQKGELDPALADFDKALAIYPGYADAYNNRGMAYHDKGQLDRAIADYDKALQLDPALVAVYNNRGIAANQQGDRERALRDYGEAIVRQPDFANAYYNRGNVLFAQGELARAEADYSRAIELDPRNAQATYNRGNIYLRTGKAAAAIADYTRTIELNPGVTEAYLNRAVAYFMIKECGRSREDVLRVQERGGAVDPAFLRDLKEACPQAGGR